MKRVTSHRPVYCVFGEFRISSLLKFRRCLRPGLLPAHLQHPVQHPVLGCPEQKELCPGCHMHPEQLAWERHLQVQFNHSLVEQQ